MSDATESAEIDDLQQPITEEPKRGRGRPPKNGLPAGSSPISAQDVPNPRIRKFYSDHDNNAQKTKALWLWWGKLADGMKDIVEAHVYREWPVLLDPSEDEKKYTDKIIGTEAIEHDQDFVDKYGAGRYHIYLNVTPAIGSRRTLAEAWIRCSHDFKKYPPTDKRIDDVSNVDLADPRNATYVAWLKATGRTQTRKRMMKWLQP